MWHPTWNAEHAIKVLICVLTILQNYQQTNLFHYMNDIGQSLIVSILEGYMRVICIAMPHPLCIGKIGINNSYSIYVTEPFSCTFCKIVSTKILVQSMPTVYKCQAQWNLGHSLQRMQKSVKVWDLCFYSPFFSAIIKKGSESVQIPLIACHQQP